MRKKISLISFFLFVIVLVSALLVTYKFIQSPEKPVEKVNVETKRKENIKNKNFQQGNTSGNLSNDQGRFSFGPKYSYKTKINGNMTELIKYKQLTDNGDIVMSSDDIRLLNQIGNYLYCVVDKNGTSKIAKIDVDNNDLMYIETTASTKKITSLIFDNNFAYYTVKDDSCIYKLNEDDSIKKIYNPSEFVGDSNLIGVLNGELYFINTKGLISVSIADNYPRLISSDLNSCLQNPILTKDGVVFFSNLRKDGLSFINLSNNDEFNLSVKNIKFFNYIDGFLFVSDGINVEISSDYINFKKIDEIKLENQPFYLSDKYLVFNNKDELKLYQITWLLVS